MTTRRDGFALLAALWVTVALSAMALVGLLVARDVLDPEGPKFLTLFLLSGLT